MPVRNRPVTLGGFGVGDAGYCQISAASMPKISMPGLACRLLPSPDHVPGGHCVTRHLGTLPPSRCSLHLPSGRPRIVPVRHINTVHGHCFAPRIVRRISARKPEPSASVAIRAKDRQGVPIRLIQVITPTPPSARTRPQVAARRSIHSRKRQRARVEETGFGQGMAPDLDHRVRAIRRIGVQRDDGSARRSARRDMRTGPSGPAPVWGGREERARSSRISTQPQPARQKPSTRKEPITPQSSRCTGGSEHLHAARRNLRIGQFAYR